MSHYVAKVLGMRPNDILDTWGCAELLVAYGQYANEEAYSAAEQWEYSYGTKKGKTPAKPKRYAVEFING